MSGEKTIWNRFRQYRDPVTAVAVSIAIVLIAAGYVNDSEVDTTTVQTEGAVFLVYPEQQQLLALDYQGRVRSVIQLEAVPQGVVPTPGGVSVFVLFKDSGIIEVYSTEDYSRQQRIQTELAAIDSLSFSPNGDRVYLTAEGDQSDSNEDTIIEYQHSRLELTQPRRVNEVPGSGRLIPDRRGTRLYRGSTSRLYSIFSQTLQVVEEYPQGLTYPAFDNGYSELWGQNPEGVAAALSERTGELVYLGSERVLEMTPVVNKKINFLSGNGRIILQFEPGSGDPPQRVELDYPAAVLVHGPGQTLWAVAADGRISEVSGHTVVAEWEIDPLRQTAGIQSGAAARIQQDGSFACF